MFRNEDFILKAKTGSLIFYTIYLNSNVAVQNIQYRPRSFAFSQLLRLLLYHNVHNTNVKDGLFVLNKWVRHAGYLSCDCFSPDTPCFLSSGCGPSSAGIPVDIPWWFGKFGLSFFIYDHDFMWVLIENTHFLHRYELYWVLLAYVYTGESLVQGNQGRLASNQPQRKKERKYLSNKL